MALTLSSGRQYALTARAIILFNDSYTDSVAEPVIQLPVNAIVTGGYIDVVTVFNNRTVASLDVGDSTTGDRYTGTIINMLTATPGTVQALDVRNYISNGDPITATIIESGGTAATQGEVHIVVEYIMTGRAHEAQTN